ncbi:hypothetical protein BaRGS_00014789 [Batillaria attramentaria]|uniref:Uncharacterized protein n=1 Tax=Batillaria attramentaria TaxID=370345 RepID=A0ABD0L3B2_9CAEN
MRKPAANICQAEKGPQQAPQYGASVCVLQEVVLHRSSSDEKLGLTLCYGSLEDEVTDIFISERIPNVSPSYHLSFVATRQTDRQTESCSPHAPLYLRMRHSRQWPRTAIKRNGRSVLGEDTLGRWERFRTLLTPCWSPGDRYVSAFPLHDSDLNSGLQSGSPFTRVRRTRGQWSWQIERRTVVAQSPLSSFARLGQLSRSTLHIWGSGRCRVDSATVQDFARLSRKTGYFSIMKTPRFVTGSFLLFLLQFEEGGGLRISNEDLVCERRGRGTKTAAAKVQLVETIDLLVSCQCGLQTKSGGTSTVLFALFSARVLQQLNVASTSASVVTGGASEGVWPLCCTPC